MYNYESIYLLQRSGKQYINNNKNAPARRDNKLTEELDMKGIQCDSKISKHSLEQLIEILELRMKYEKDKQMIIKQSSSDIEALLLMKGSNTFDKDVCVYI